MVVLYVLCVRLVWVVILFGFVGVFRLLGAGCLAIVVCGDVAGYVYFVAFGVYNVFWCWWFNAVLTCDLVW